MGCTKALLTFWVDGYDLENVCSYQWLEPRRYHCMPVGFYVSVSNSYGQWNTTIKVAMADSIVPWNESLVIQGCFKRVEAERSRRGEELINECIPQSLVLRGTRSKYIPNKRM
jgi:hypothetical protein